MFNRDDVESLVAPLGSKQCQEILKQVTLWLCRDESSKERLEGVICILLPVLNDLKGQPSGDEDGEENEDDEEETIIPRNYRKEFIAYVDEALLNPDRVEDKGKMRDREYCHVCTQQCPEANHPRLRKALNMVSFPREWGNTTRHNAWVCEEHAKEANEYINRTRRGRGRRRRR